MKKQKFSDDNSDELSTLIKNYDITLIAYVLKNYTDKDHALSCEKLNELMNNVVNIEDSSVFGSRTTKRKLEIIENLSDSAVVSKILNPIFASTYGGYVKYREADGIYNKQYSHKQGTQKRYYFEPLLETADMDLVYGTLNSSRYLSDAEKDYLLARLGILHPTLRTDIGIPSNNRLPEKPPSIPKVNPHTLPLPGASSNMLRNVQIIHTAIEKEVQIEVLYGIYDISERSTKVTFHARNKNNEPYILNPYALLWNDGEYYLVASEQKYDNPTHFRADRIIEVTIHTERNDIGYVVEAKRAKIPDVLKEYYERNEKGKVIFNGIKYANTHPGMAIRKEKRLITCAFECTNWSLQILIDNFGSDIRIEKSTRVHDASEVDYNGNPQEFLIATIRNVQYDNAKRFAISNCQYLTVVRPDELIVEVKEVLKEAVKKLG